MKRRYISYGRQTIDSDDVAAVCAVLESDWLTQGKVVDEFEGQLCNRLGANYAVAVSSGTAALHLCALSLKWSPGDVVFTSPLSFVATSNCVEMVGACVRFVDIDPSSWTIDVQKLEYAIQRCKEDSTGKAKAIIAVDFAGHPADWKALREIADKYQLDLVNDSSHAIGAKYFGDHEYGVKYADIVTLSFHPVKHVTTGEGGAVLTNSSTLAHDVRVLRSHGIEKQCVDKSDGVEPWSYEMVRLGFNYRITDFQCALGISQIKKLDVFLEQRKKQAKYYFNNLEVFESICLPPVQECVDHAWHIFPIQMDFSKIGYSRTHVFNYFHENGVGLQVHYIPIHTQPYYMNKYGTEWGNFPVSENYYSQAISLPLFPSLTEAEQQRIAQLIENIVS